MENQDKKFVLVLSGGGSKGLYACGVLKAIEVCGVKEEIAAVYGVSAGALSAAYWLSGWKAEDILERFLSAQLFSLKNIALPPKMSLLKSSVVEQFLKEDIKSDFAELELPLYVGATDIWQAAFKLFSQ
ncbi:MAG: patatin-like phospholipase family protein [bacterium]|nr:patatin-like phospholipase family protein [bacterium]